MHLIYLDESGQSGNNLNDPHQQVFVLAALPIPENLWLLIEQELQSAIDQAFPAPRPENFEIHATELINPRNNFRQIPIPHRLEFLEAWFGIAKRHKLKVIHRGIVKKRFSRWLTERFGAGISINPHVAAFALISQVINEYLKTAPGSPLGIFISDENKEVMHDVDKSIRLLRGIGTSLKLSQIVEKGFFIESHKSLLLQLCDLFAYSLRKYEEEKTGLKIKPIDEHLIPLVQPLIHRGNESMPDVLAWLEEMQKKGAARELLTGPEKGPNRTGR